MIRFKKKHFAILILLWLGVVFYLTFWPFNFIYKNSVTFPAEGGLHFKSPSIAYLRQLPARFNDIQKFTIFTEVKPDDSDEDKGGVLFGYCYDHIRPNFIVIQAGRNMYFNLTDKIGVHYLGADDIFEKDKSVWITITYDGEKITFLKNGSVRNVDTLKYLNFSCWNNSFPFVFANTGIGTIPWSGTIYSLDIFDSVVTISNGQQRDSIRNLALPILSLSFPHTQIQSNNNKEDFSEASIVIPAMFDPPAKGLIYNICYLFGKWEWDFLLDSDFLLNILFFVPLGLFLRPLLEKSTRRYSLSFWLTLMIGLLLTIIIESIQIILPDRDTSIMDVLGNTLGTIIGAMIISISWVRKLLNLQRQK